MKILNQNQMKEQSTQISFFDKKISSEQVKMGALANIAFLISVVYMLSKNLI